MNIVVLVSKFCMERLLNIEGYVWISLRSNEILVLLATMSCQ